MRRCLLHVSLILSAFALSIVGCNAKFNITQKTIFPPLKSPPEVVELFHQAYGTARMDEIGPYTTERFRKDRPISVWVAEVWKQLKDFEYEKLSFKILESTINEENGNAVVVAHTKLNTKAGVTKRNEVFILVFENDRWLIDELYVTDKEIGSGRTKL